MSNSEHTKLSIIDSHTGGEPTRVVVAWPEDIVGLDRGSLRDRRALLKQKYDWIRSVCLLEPRGHEAMVGALLCKPVNPDCVAGVIFFNNVGYLNSCIHGTIGLTVTLAYMGLISAGKHRIETPVGEVISDLHPDGRVTVANVPSYRYRQNVEVEVDGYGCVVGDIAWGGNWFFLAQSKPNSGPEVVPKNISELTRFASAIVTSLGQQGVTGDDGAIVDHVQLFGEPTPDVSDSRSFVLCPGLAYDRSPCGSGTSAKLACLFADGKLKEGEIWRQASILNTVFEGQVADLGGGRITPSISGIAFVNSEATLIIQQRDPFGHGIRHA